ncbi:MAG TPA: hypothetical protein VFJ75_09735 [Gaiellaceae bacterium]|nr:hypothetical protein [Gaiellaceae bacterium]
MTRRRLRLSFWVVVPVDAVEVVATGAVPCVVVVRAVVVFAFGFGFVLGRLTGGGGGGGGGGAGGGCAGAVVTAAVTDSVVVTSAAVVVGSVDVSAVVVSSGAADGERAATANPKAPRTRPADT